MPNLPGEDPVDKLYSLEKDADIDFDGYTGIARKGKLAPESQRQYPWGKGAKPEGRLHNDESGERTAASGYGTPSDISMESGLSDRTDAEAKRGNAVPKRALSDPFTGMSHYAGGGRTPYTICEGNPKNDKESYREVGGEDAP